MLKMYCEKLFPLSALKSKTFCNLRQECYKYLTKSKGNSTSGLEVSFKEFIRSKCFCYVFLGIVGPNYKTLDRAENLNTSHLCSLIVCLSNLGFIALRISKNKKLMLIFESILLLNLNLLRYIVCISNLALCDRDMNNRLTTKTTCCFVHKKCQKF